LGALAVPLSWRLTAEEVAGLLADTEPAVVVAGPEEAARAGAGAVVVGEVYEAWLAPHRGAGRPRPHGAVGPGDPALVLSTSGTTARPKGVVLTHGNLAAMVAATLAMVGLGPDSVHLVCMPLFHIAGLGAGLAGLAAGAATVLLPDADPARVVAAIERHRVTHVLLVPTALRRVVEHLEDVGGDVSSMTSVVYGASPIAVDVLERALRAFPTARFHQTYGLTETTGRVVVLGPEEHRAGGPRLRAAGRPLPGVDVRLDGGEICVRGPQVMAGYWRRPEETAAVLDADGWLRTGDAGVLDADGYLYVTDRIKDVIVTGGENVSPAEIEAVLRRHPAVADVAVVGVPDDRWGEAVRAFVVAAPGAVLDAADLDAFARRHLAGFKCPKGFEVVDDLPRSASGKVLKRELRAAQGTNERPVAGGC
jgi:long-chain acyl-CoA synthetase